MKLRINKQSIRLRLSQTDVITFKNHKFIEEDLHFPGARESKFTFSLRQAKDHEFTADFQSNQIRVIVPMDISEAWVNSDEVGFQKNIVDKDGSTLFILIEKDFQCLSPLNREDESDNYPNPNQNC